MSSVLAFVMLFSSLVMVNVVSVSAEPLNWSATDENAGSSDWLKFDTQYELGACNDNKSAKFADTIFKENTSGVVKDEKAYISQNKSATFSVTTTTEKSTLVLYAYLCNSFSAGDNVLKCTTIKEESSASGGLTVLGKSSSTTELGSMEPLHITLNGIDTFSFTLNKATLCIFKASLISDDDGGDDTNEYKWVLKNDKLTAAGMSTVAAGLSLPSPTLTDRNYLTYDGSDKNYTLIPNMMVMKKGLTDSQGATIVEADAGDPTGKTFNVTPTKDMFMKNVNIPKNNIAIKGGANRVLHLTCNTHNTTYSILLDDATDNEEDIAHAKGLLVSDGNGYYTLSESDTIDLPIHDDTYKATMAGGNLTIDSAPEGNITLSADANTINGEFNAITSTAVQKDTGKIDVFSGLKTTGEGIAERLYTGTVLGPEGGKYFRVVGPTGPDYQENYGNIYAISGTEESEAPGSDAFAVVIRSNDDDTVNGGGIGFDISSNVKAGSKFDLDVYCTAVPDRQTGGSTTTIGLTELNVDQDTKVESFGSPVSDSPKNVTMVEESNTTAPGQPITFENLEPGKSYAIYNPGKASENGNIRVYAMALKIKEGEASGDTLVDVLDPAKIDSGALKANASKDPSSNNGAQQYTTGGGADGMAGTKFTITGGASIETLSAQTLELPDGNKIENATKVIKFGGSTGDAKKNITFETEAGSAGGKLYVYVVSDSDSAKANFIFDKSGSKETKQDVVPTRTSVPGKLEFNIEPGTTYKIYASTKYNVFYIGSTIPLKALGEPEVKVPVITGKVTLKDEYKYIEPTGVTDKEGGTVTPNVIEPGSNNNKKALNKTIAKDVTDLKVTVQPADGSAVDADKIKIEGDTFTIGGEEGLAPNTKYTVTVTAGGATAKQEVDLKETAATANFDLTTPSVTVRFVTNIKNYSDSNDGGTQKLPKIQTSDGTDLFELADTTYYTKGADTSSLEAVNGSASTTHIVSMPKGKYKYVYDSNYYTLSQDSSGASDNMDFEVTASGRKYIYFTPQIDQLKTDVTNNVDTAKGSLTSNVVRGKYTFAVPSGTSTANSVDITYEGTASEDKDGQHLGMLAYGIQGGTGYNDYLGINQEHGAVVFKLDKPMLAHITTEQKACALYNVEYRPLARSADTSINGAFGLIPIDSSFSRRFISLDAGTYALVSLTTDAEKPAKVTSIEFVENAPFVVKEQSDIIDYREDDTIGKMIIGTYDSDNDDLIGTTSAASYSTFAILVANSRDALTAANIDNIVGGTGYNKGESLGSDVTKSDDSDSTYTPKAFAMTVGNETTYTVLRDDTDTIFSKIVGADGRAIKENTSEEGGEKYYATIVKNLDPGIYFAIGAAKVNGATESAEKGAWLVQETPVEFTVG